MDNGVAFVSNVRCGERHPDAVLVIIPVVFEAFCESFG